MKDSSKTLTFSEREPSRSTCHHSSSLCCARFLLLLFFRRPLTSFFTFQTHPIFSSSCPFAFLSSLRWRRRRRSFSRSRPARCILQATFCANQVVRFKRRLTNRRLPARTLGSRNDNCHLRKIDDNLLGHSHNHSGSHPISEVRRALRLMPTSSSTNTSCLAAHLLRMRCVGRMLRVQSEAPTSRLSPLRS